MNGEGLNREVWLELAGRAWQSRENAHVLGNTKVGAAVLASDQTMYAGCNIEHQFRSHDIHAEVNAISTMVAAGRKKIVAIIVVAERDRFTPCGACMDWIFQFGGPECLVGYQKARDGEIKVFRADELMPFYPN